jgi:hypothetical protein
MAQSMNRGACGREGSTKAAAVANRIGSAEENSMDINSLFALEQRITQLETTLPGLRIARRRHPHVASFQSDVRNREFQIANLKGELQRLQAQVSAGESW